MSDHTSTLRNALEGAGLRTTKQRLAVLEALARRDDAVTAQELHQELLRRDERTGLATVYRTLAALAEAGELDTFQREGEQAFRLCGTDHHHHLVCESCGSVQEVAGDEVETWVARTARRHEFRVTGHRADIFGVCRSCR